MTGPSIGSHAPRRPAWMCIWCREPYPCPDGRVQLLAAQGGYTPELAVRAVELMELAIADLGEVPVDELYRRFLAWTKPLEETVRWRSSST